MKTKGNMCQIVPGSSYYCITFEYFSKKHNAIVPIMFNFHKDTEGLENLAGVNLKYIINDLKVEFDTVEGDAV